MHTGMHKHTHTVIGSQLKETLWPPRVPSRTGLSSLVFCFANSSPLGLSFSPVLGLSSGLTTTFLLPGQAVVAGVMVLTELVSPLSRMDSVL